MMQKTAVLFGTLLLTNAVAGLMWWRSNQQGQQLSEETRVFSRLYQIELKENMKLSAIPTKTSNGNEVLIPKSTDESLLILPEAHRKSSLKVLADNIKER